MPEKEKREIAEMTETAKMLAKYDPQSLMIAKSNLDILKNRCEIERAMQKEATEEKAG